MNLPVLLCEPQSLLRQTVGLTSRSLGIGPVYQAASLSAALRLAKEHAFVAAIVSLDADESDASSAPAIALISTLRSGETPSEKTLPVLVTAASCDRDVLEALSSLGVRKILIKPFKARLLIDALTEIAAAASDVRGNFNAVTHLRR